MSPMLRHGKRVQDSFCDTPNACLESGHKKHQRIQSRSLQSCINNCPENVKCLSLKVQRELCYPFRQQWSPAAAHGVEDVVRHLQ